MTKVQFGLVVPADALDKSRRQHYVEDVNRLLATVKGTYSSAWVIDHLQFQDSDLLEGWTTLTYFAALHPTGATTRSGRTARTVLPCLWLLENAIKPSDLSLAELLALCPRASRLAWPDLGPNAAALRREFKKIRSLQEIQGSTSKHSGQFTTGNEPPSRSRRSGPA